MGRVIRGHERPAFVADIGGLLCGEGQRLSVLYTPAADALPIVIQRNGSALTKTAAVIGELCPYLTSARRQRLLRFRAIALKAEVVVDEVRLAVLGVEAPAAEPSALSDDDAFGNAIANGQFSGDRERDVLDVHHCSLGESAHARKQQLRVALHERRTPGYRRIDALHHAIV